MDDNVPPPGSTQAPQPPPSAPPPLIVPRYVPPPPRRSAFWKIVALVLLVLLVVSVVTNVSQLFDSVIPGEVTATRKAGPRLHEAVIEHNDSRNKVVVVSVEGIIASDMGGTPGYGMVEYIRDQFERAADRQDVKAVILKVNSPGGEVLASDEIYDLITKFQADTKKPVIASMSSVAASGGYYVAAPCRWIVADEMTITGSIGVIMSTFNVRNLMDKVGVQPIVFKSGRYKDMLSMTRKPEETTPEERKMMQDLIDETFGKFKKVVAEGRQRSNKMNQGSNQSGQQLVDDWEQYADGRVFSGEQAYKYGFVDELGNWETAKQRALALAGIPDANFVQYQPEFSLANLFQILGKSEKTTLKLDLGLSAPAVKPGYLYFLSPSYLQ
jgi:protease IV